MQNNYLRNEIARVYNKYTLCGKLKALEYANGIIENQQIEINGKIDALIVMICFNHNFCIIPCVKYSNIERYRKIVSLLSYKRYHTFHGTKEEFYVYDCIRNIK